MKKIVIAAIFSGIAGLAAAQQAPQFTQFSQTGNLLNPAFTGIGKNADIKVGYRKQWAGLQGSPATMFAAGSAMLGTEEPVLSLPVRGRLASQFRTEKPEVKDDLKHCIGGYLLMDKTGPTAQNRAGFTYAANMPWKNGYRLAIGAGLLFSQTSLNRGDLNISPDRDPGIGTGMSSKVRPDLQLGFTLYSEKMFAGYSASYLFGNKLFTLDKEDKIFAHQKAHHYVFAGYKYEFTPEWAFVPSLMVKYTGGAPVGFETNFRFNYGSRAWFGAAFRPQDAVSGFAGFHLSNTLNLAYSYDYNISKLNAFNSGSHEIILGIRFVRAGEKLHKPGLW